MAPLSPHLRDPSLDSIGSRNSVEKWRLRRTGRLRRAGRIEGVGMGKKKKAQVSAHSSTGPIAF